MAMRIESLEVLEKADVSAAQARAIVRAIEIETSRAADALATKNDFAAIRQELIASMASLATGAEVDQVRGEMHALASSGTRQMYLAILGQMAVLLGFAYFFATHLR